MKHSQIEDFDLMGLRARFGPIGLWIYANDFLASSRALPVQMPPPYQPSRYFLPCRALELALKAFLSLKGRLLGELATGKFAHDLSALMDEAEKNGLSAVVNLNDQQRGRIKHASKYYSEKVLEYPALIEAFQAYPDLPDTEPLLDLTEQLLREIKPACQAA